MTRRRGKTATEIATKAAELVGGDRRAAYGDAVGCWTKVAAVWNGIRVAAGLPPDIDAHTAANMMEGLKIARRYIGPFNIDDYVDGAGYAAVAGEIAGAQQ
jgi:hypothetical protein